ncbi:MAG: hypothetical protein AAF443_05965 [Chlamydiota bacterium]
MNTVQTVSLILSTLIGTAAIVRLALESTSCCRRCKKIYSKTSDGVSLETKKAATAARQNFFK